jgi:hypothetical protein
MTDKTKTILEYSRAYLGVGLFVLGYIKGWWVF